MKRLTLVCFAASTLAGCAGLATPFINNPYAGTYDGTFTTSDGKAGPASVQLTKLGHVFGTLTDTATGKSGSLTGSVGTSLSFGGTVDFPSDDHNVTGTMTANQGLVTGTLTGTDGYTCTLNVTKS